MKVYEDERKEERSGGTQDTNITAANKREVQKLITDGSPRKRIKTQIQYIIPNPLNS